jgi:hypothetical protein
MTASSILRPAARWSGVCFAVAGMCFIVGWLLILVAAPDLVAFFYQPRPLAITHTFTLGWISLTMIGVLYQYVPALTKHAVLWPRAVGWQITLFVIGVSGLITHFWIGHLVGMAWSAGVIWISVLLFAVQLALPLWRAPQADATVIGLLAALACFVGTATLGLLYAIDKVAPFVGGSVLRNLAAHAHLGLLGWITLTMCAVSYRMVPAFVLPETALPSAAAGQILSLAVLVPLLVLCILVDSAATPFVAVLVVGSLVWYGRIVIRLLRTRRMEVDWSLRHVIAGLAHLAAAAACGLELLFLVDPGSEIGSRTAVAYGAFLLVGWISNYIIGVGSRMIPGLMGRGARPLLPPGGGALLFGLLNGGVVAVVGSVLAGSPAGLRIAVLLPLLAALLFTAGLVRRLWAAQP